MDRKYQIALINVPFDNTYSNTIRFDTRAEQEEYFNVNNLSFSAPINFNFGSLLETSVVYRDNSITSIDLLNKNYAIIKETINGVSKYLYFFIRRAVFDTLSQINIGLELDVIQTFYIDMNFQDCIIETAHLDRFNETTGDMYSFNNNIDSPLFIRDTIRNASKRPVQRDKVHFVYDTTPNTSFNQWLSEYVGCWCYIYLKSDVDGYKFIPLNGEGTTDYNIDSYVVFENGSYKNPYKIICYPILKNGGKIILNLWGELKSSEWDFASFNNFMELNNGTSHIIQVKFSTVAPFSPGNYDNSFTIDNDTLTLNAEEPGGSGSGNMVFWNGLHIGKVAGYGENVSFDKCLGAIFQQDCTKPLESIPISIQDHVKTNFSKDDIKNDRDIKLNPKLYNSDYSALRIMNEGEYFDYDIQKLNKTSLTFLYTEIFTPDITRGYLRIKGDSGEIYNTIMSTNYTGLVYSQDYTLPYSVNQLDTFLNNNKNFYMQRALGYGQQGFNAAIDYTVGSAGAAATAVANPVAGVSQAIGAKGNLIKSLAGIAVDYVQSNLTIDNMLSAPEQLHNANGNALFNMGVTGIGLYVEVIRALDNELAIVDDIMFKYGFTYGRNGNIKNFDNIRKYFNYIQAQIEAIYTPLSNNIKQKIREIFSNGIRFWNFTDEMFKFDKENYEVYLDE